MKPIRLQLKEALDGKNGVGHRDFTLTIIAGLAILYGVIFGMAADSVRAPFDFKVAIGCFVLAGVCVLLASDRVLALSCAVMVPGALIGFSAVLTGNRKALAFRFVVMAVGLVILVLGTLARSLWQARPSRRNKHRV
jgi:hypothetical protein